MFQFHVAGSHGVTGLDASRGIVPRAIHDIFDSLTRKNHKDGHSSMSMVFLTYIELYNNNVYDLLACDQSSSVGLRIHDHPTLGVTITG